jgi:glycosyltransferase involved in cell wall biosynthesis
MPWDLQHEYLRESGLGWGPRGLAARWMLHRLRAWDVRAAGGVDRFVANSAFIARRIRKTYRRPARIIHPPVDIAAFAPTDAARGDYYVTASRFVAYKRIPMIVEAFAGMRDRQLVVIGDGPQRREVARLAAPNVRVLGHLPRPELARWVAGARAFVFAAIEDFGIAPVEAQAAGTPVIAYAGGALPETIRGLGADEPTGVLYHEQTPDALRDAVARFEAVEHEFSPAACRANAERFSAERFREEFAGFVRGALAAHRRRLERGESRRPAGPHAGLTSNPEGRGTRGREPARRGSVRQAGQLAPRRPSTAPAVRRRMPTSRRKLHART